MVTYFYMFYMYLINYNGNFKSSDQRLLENYGYRYGGYPLSLDIAQNIVYCDE